MLLSIPFSFYMHINHDRVIHRKAEVAGVSTKWISEVLWTSVWNNLEEIEIHDVCYNHGEAGTARTRMKTQLHSLVHVHGHLYAECYTDWTLGSIHKVFELYVGCGLYRDSYAMSDGKIFKKPVKAYAIVLNIGTLPINLLMNI